MTQTLMALVALMIAMQISLVNQRSVLSARVAMIDSEIETIATGAGLDLLDYIGSMAFDEETKTKTVTDPEDLTDLPFITGGLFEEADDIDDFHQIQPYIYTSDVGNLSFDVTIEVRYVNDDDIAQVSNTPTFSKEVVLTLSHPSMKSSIELSRVYSYP